MAETRKKRVRITSPQGRAIYPYLNKPDTKFNAEGVYTVKLAVPEKVAEGMVEQIDAAMKASLVTAQEENKGKKVKEADPPFSFNEEEGEYVFSFKMKATGTNKETKETWTRKPAIFDAKGKPLLNAKIGGGSVLRVAYEIMPFYTKLVGAGVSLQLGAVQVIKLVEFGGADAKGYGFSEEEGYEGTEAQATEAPAEKDEEEKAPEGAAASGDF